jgi:PmbA protein
MTSAAIKSACLIAKYTQDDPFNGLAPKELMAFDTPDLDLYHPWDLDAQQPFFLPKNTLISKPLSR